MNALAPSRSLRLLLLGGKPIVAVSDVGVGVVVDIERKPALRVELEVHVTALVVPQTSNSSVSGSHESVTSRPLPARCASSRNCVSMFEVLSRACVLILPLLGAIGVESHSRVAPFLAPVGALVVVRARAPASGSAAGTSRRWLPGAAVLDRVYCRLCGRSSTRAIDQCNHGGDPGCADPDSDAVICSFEHERNSHVQANHRSRPRRVRGRLELARCLRPPRRRRVHAARGGASPARGCRRRRLSRSCLAQLDGPVSWSATRTPARDHGRGRLGQGCRARVCRRIRTRRGRVDRRPAGPLPVARDGEFLQPRPLPDGSAELSVDPDRFQSIFCADVPDDVAAFMAHAQRPLVATAFEEAAAAAAWHTKPSWGCSGPETNRSLWSSTASRTSGPAPQ